MKYNKFAPVVVSFIRRAFIDGIYREYTCYVAYCGNCGNPIERFTSRKFCRYCRFDVDWENYKNIKPHRFKVDDHAIKSTVDRI